MGVFSGPDISESGIVFALDAGNKKSFANSLINSTSWSLGSGGTSGYGANGPTSENERIRRTDPFGRYANVWETRPSGDGGADGGWNTSWFNIDNTKLHRFSVWVRRTSIQTSGGTFYLGLYGNNSGVRRTDNNAYEGNPYWECSGTSKFSPFTWYLVVGHCYPYNTTYTGQHPETGIYTTAGGATKVLSVNACNIGADVKWAGSDVTQAIHRCYHYYCADSTTRLQLFDPRVDVIDGTEPSIKDLLSGYTASKLMDLTKLNTEDSIILAYYTDVGIPLPFQSEGIKANDGIFVNGPTYDSANGGSIVFDGVNDHISIAGSNNPTQSITLEAWINPNRVPSTGTIRGGVLSGDPTHYLGIFDSIDGGVTHSLHFALQTSSGRPGSQVGNIPRNAWSHIVGTYDGTRMKAYLNGVMLYDVALTGTISGSGNWTIGCYQPQPTDGTHNFDGKISNAKIYSRSLMASEIQQNFNALRGRYGI